MTDNLDTAVFNTSIVEFDPFSGPEILLIAPATESQTEIWTSCLIGGAAASCAYNECASLLLTGNFDRDAMLRSLQAMVNMHQALRLSFSADGKNICIYKELHLDIDYQDLSSLLPNRQQEFIDNYNKQLVLTPFDLVKGPLLKASLIKVSANEHYITFVAHHIVCDGWSIGIMMQDLGQLYSAYTKREKISLPDSPLFSNYALELSAQRDKGSYKEVESYWLEQFRGSDHLLDIPSDYPRPALRTYKSHRIDLTLDAALTNSVKQLGKSAGSSFVTTLLSAFEVFLHQLTGQDEIILGLPAAGQPATDNFRLVGHCVNLLALRSHPKGDLSFKSYLKKRRSDILDAYDHQLYTFGSLLKKLNIPRDASRIPLVPVMFNIDMGLDDHVSFFGLEHKLISIPREYENFELFLNVAGKDESPTLEWSYNTQLFKTDTIRWMMDSFEFLLRQLVSNPDILIGGIPLKNAGELKLQLAGWNNTRCSYPRNRPLHSLISDTADKHPDKTAITFGDSKTSYRALNESANQLACVLQNNLVKKGDKVAFALDRSAEMVISILAIMKTGAVYVPLDPQFPLNRINYMLADSKATVLLTSRKYKGTFQSDAKELVIEDEWVTMQGHSADNPPIEVSSDDVVYILYTSGSTGMPKGVQISHYSLVNFLYSMQREPGISAGDKLLAVTTISFDIAGLELFLPLLSGAEVVLADSASSKDGRALLTIIKNEKVTMMQATPYTWRIMLEAGWDNSSPLKVICGGEALPIELAGRLINRSTSLWNVYGPTETTIWSTIKQIKKEDKSITIGRPINNTSVYILNKYLNPVSPGTAGEIYIGGDGVSKGYLNMPGLTAEKFIYDPFADEAGSKMYRTGDCGKFMANGEIECLGRIDAQVKIRGYRIETEEIEHHLEKEAGISEAVVIARPDKSGVNRLVAFVVVSNNDTGLITAANTQTFKDLLKGSLPDYMVPDNFFIMPAIPLTPNGKVDKKALAKYSESLTEGSNTFVGPRTDIEKLVADIWSEFLEIKKIGMHDNFFELGGHSLIAVQVMTRIEKETGKRLPLAALFETSTVEKLAQLLELGAKSITWDSLVPIKPKGNKMPLYMVHGAGLNVLLFNTLAMNMSPDQPVYGLQAKGLNGVDEPLTKIEDIAAHYISAITGQNPNGPYALAGYSFGGIIAFEMAKQLQAAGKVVKLLAMFDTYAYRSPFYDPWLKKILKRGRFFLSKILYAFSFSNGFKNTVTDKRLSLKRKMTRYYWKFKYGKDQNQTGFFGYSNKIDEMNNFAERNYQLKPNQITVDVFRAENRTFYMDDFEHLGWKPYALEGVKIHVIPGEHNTIFKAPNDKLFAVALQKCLDEAVKD